MKSYSGIIATLIIALVVVAMVVNQRAQLVWQTLLGNTHVVQGTPPTPSPQVYVYQFTPIGVIVLGWLAVRYGKGSFGLAVAYMLGALLLVTGLMYGPKIMPLLVNVNSQGKVPG